MTHPSLQWGQVEIYYSAYVAGTGFVQHNLGGMLGIGDSNLDFV
ncbi:hypothetical protein [Methyloglobulus sp.]